MSLSKQGYEKIADSGRSESMSKQGYQTLSDRQGSIQLRGTDSILQFADPLVTEITLEWSDLEVYVVQYLFCFVVTKSARRLNINLLQL